MNFNIKQELNARLIKYPYVALNLTFLILSLGLAWLTSGLYIYLKDIKMEKGLADISLLVSYFIVIGIMALMYKVTPNDKSFKKDILKEFFSEYALLKSAILYILSISLISSNSQSFGTALLIPYYMFVINFYTSISSGEIKKGWF